VKFLNDDDRLRPGCVAALAAVFHAKPEVRLATTKRQPIDDAGAPLRDTPATVPISETSIVLSGRELGDFVLARSVNLIGEPTTVMFRRADLALEEGAIFRWGGRDYHCLADLGVWLRLLESGLAYYGVVPLSEFPNPCGPGAASRGCAHRLPGGTVVDREAGACAWVPRFVRGPSPGAGEPEDAHRAPDGAADLRVRKATLEGLLGEVEGEIAALR
jgi:hypothetical protein